MGYCYQWVNTPQITDLNQACKNTGFYEEGVWSYDLYGPEDDSLWRFSFRLSMYPGNRTNYPDEPMANPSHVQIVSSLGLDKNGVPNSEFQVQIAQIQNNPWSGWIILGGEVVTESQLRGWHRYTINKNSTHLDVYLDGDYLVGGSLSQPLLEDYNAICMWAEVGSEIQVDNIAIEPSPITSTKQSSETPGNASSSSDRDEAFLQYFAVGAGLIGISSIAYFSTLTIKKRLKISIKALKYTTDTIRNLNQSFDLSDKSMLLLFLGHKSDEKYLDELQNTVQHDLIKYRYLMQPTRLMMMKLLHGEYSLTSVQMVKLLNIPWANYSTHIKSLEKNGYVDIKDDFDEDGGVRQVIVLTDTGKKEYEVLYEILQEFMEKKTPLDYILNKDRESYMNDDLYPNE